jgi:hypothetical protein
MAKGVSYCAERTFAVERMRYPPGGMPVAAANESAAVLIDLRAMP